MEGKVVRNQLTKAGTSVGANYRETNRSRSKPDFKNKISNVETETSETIFWPEIIEEMEWIDYQKLQPIHNEAYELLAIFTSIGKNIKI